MFKRDLIAKYGAGSGVREKELRTALSYRRKLIAFVTVMGLGLLSLLFLIDPWAPLMALGILTGIGLLFLLFGTVAWFADGWERNMSRIKNAKAYGVQEDHSG